LLPRKLFRSSANFLPRNLRNIFKILILKNELKSLDN
jgi:hypothetical protein